MHAYVHFALAFTQLWHAMFLLSSILACRQEEEISKIWQQKKSAYGGRETEQTQESDEIQTEKVLTPEEVIQAKQLKAEKAAVRRA